MTSALIATAVTVSETFLSVARIARRAFIEAGLTEEEADAELAAMIAVIGSDGDVIEMQRRRQERLDKRIKR